MLVYWRVSKDYPEKMISCFDVKLPESLKQFRKNVGKMN